MKIEKNELNIYEVEALYKELLAQSQNDEILLDMSDVQKVDMSIIQLFVSTQKTLAQSSKEFKLQNVHENVLNTLKECACDFLLGNDT